MPVVAGPEGPPSLASLHGRAQTSPAQGYETPGVPMVVSGCVGPRGDFPRLEKSRMARAHASIGAWAVACLFVARAERGQGIGLELVRAATALAFARGASEVQAYPAPVKAGARSVDVFAWTGVPAMFPAKDGWRRIDDGSGRPALRRKPISPSARAKAPSRG